MFLKINVFDSQCNKTLWFRFGFDNITDSKLPKLLPQRRKMIWTDDAPSGQEPCPEREGSVGDDGVVAQRHHSQVMTDAAKKLFNFSSIFISFHPFHRFCSIFKLQSLLF